MVSGEERPPDAFSTLRRGWQSPRGGSGRRSTVDVILQLLAGLEKRNALGRDINFGARLGIAPGAPAPLACAEAAEAANFNAIAALQCADNAFENGFHNRFGFFTWKFGDAYDLFNKVRFCH